MFVSVVWGVPKESERVGLWIVLVLKWPVTASKAVNGTAAIPGKERVVGSAHIRARDGMQLPIPMTWYPARLPD